ncbi:hypothetical protein [Streptomyces sp. NPDC004783]|uniref:hypothetical protein n=1 Tax=Streptomyces sp. NPDC004783 TaxID=3154459 RepID=UPI0033A08A58
MKPLKAAAILAGALAVTGAATPAFAHGGTGDAAGSLAGAAKQIAGEPVAAQSSPQHLRTVETQGGESVSRVLEGTGKPVVQRAGGPMIGGLPV